MTRIDADWLQADSTQSVLRLLNGAGHQAYAVGGCVRDSLLLMPVKDIDIATDAHPERVMELAAKARLHAIPTGIEHGTVTVVAKSVPHEVTTFRRDVETHGRRATVAFSDRIEDDARRRDFTMNALYADASGAVADPIGGMPDLRARRVRFIEDASTRIREDYLRSLRYFRFHAWYGDPSEGFDIDALDAIARETDGLALLSRERVGAELKRLLEAADPAPSVAGMRQTGVLASVLPGADDTALAALIELEFRTNTMPDAIRRLAVLGGADVAERLRLSRKEAARLSELRDNVGAGDAAALGYRLGADGARDVLLLTAATTGSNIGPDDLDKAGFGATQHFPLRAADLMPGIEGPALGRVMKRLENEWIDSGFRLARDELLARAGQEG